MSTAEKLRNEGIAKGRAEGQAEALAKGQAEGMAKGQAETLLRLLRKRFGDVSPQFVTRLQTGALADLDRWTDRFLDARTLDDVFGDS